MKNTEDIMPDERAECCLFYNGRGSEGITASLKLPKLRENDLFEHQTGTFVTNLVTRRTSRIPKNRPALNASRRS